MSRAPGSWELATGKATNDPQECARPSGRVTCEV